MAPPARTRKPGFTAARFLLKRALHVAGRSETEELARDDAGRLKDGEIERLKAELAEARGGKGPDG